LTSRKADPYDTEANRPSPDTRPYRDVGPDRGRRYVLGGRGGSRGGKFTGHRRAAHWKQDGARHARSRQDPSRDDEPVGWQHSVYG
jgi:hypothetical protein